MTRTRVCFGSIDGLSSISLEHYNEPGQQWWSLEALRLGHKTVFPKSLSFGLEPILHGEIAPEPSDIGPCNNPPA